MSQVPTPIPLFFEADGSPLDGGYIYIGTIDLDAQTNPIQVYWDADFTVPASQPIRTLAGYPAYQGAPSGIYVNASGYSITTKDRNQVSIITNANDSPLSSAIGAPEGAGLVGFIQDDDEAVATTALAKMRESVSIGDFGGDGVGVDDDAVTRAEASAFPFIDLVGRTITTTLPGNSLTKSYYNGTLLANNSVSGRFLTVVNASPLADFEISRRRTKSPILDWVDLSGLWLGTSIPAFGATPDRNSYPQLFAHGMRCSVVNTAWAGSHAFYDVDGDPFSGGTVTALSMTEDDRLAGLAAYGSTSAYSDTSPLSVITKPSEQTFDFRIKAQFAAQAFEFVVLDHCHNDALQVPGDNDYETISIASITKGADTNITLSSIGSVTIGDALILRVEGIGKLDHHVCRVQSVAGNVVTISLDSSGFSGSFTSGTVAKVDRTTIWGAFEFLIHGIYWAAILYDRPEPKIILASPPSAWSDYERRDQMHSTAEVLKDIGDANDLTFFDGLYLYDVKLPDQPIYLSDGTHPATLPERQSYANFWMAWAQGGTVKTIAETDFLPSAALMFTDQREAVYSDFAGGFTTPSFLFASAVNVITDDFSDGDYAGWTPFGTSPTVIDAPWGAGKALNCISAAGNPSAIARACVTDDASQVEFDIYLPVTSGVVPPSTVGLATVLRLDNSLGNPAFEMQILFTETAAFTRMGYYANPDLTGGGFVPLSEVEIQPATKYTIGFTGLLADTGYLGGVKFSIDGVTVARLSDLDNLAQTVPQTVSVGIAYTSVSALDLSVGNIVIDKIATVDFEDRYTGPMTVGAQTATVVNGIIVSVA